MTKRTGKTSGKSMKKPTTGARTVAQKTTAATRKRAAIKAPPRVATASAGKLQSVAPAVSASREAEMATIDTTADSATEARQIRKKDIYDHVTIATGLRKREVREAVDAALAYLNEQLAAGYEIQAPPLGKIRVITQGEGDEARLRYKLNLHKPSDQKKDGGMLKEALEAAAE